MLETILNYSCQQAAGSKGYFATNVELGGIKHEKHWYYRVWL